MGRHKKSDEPKDGAALISGAKLCALTGYTDVWHRKAAKDGYFPPPVNGYYQTVPTLQGLFRRERDMRQKVVGSLPAKKEMKLEKEIELLTIDIDQKHKNLISVPVMVGKITPALTAMRQRILASTLTEEERDQLLDDLGQILDDAIKQPIPGTSQSNSTNPDEAPQADRQQVGG